MRRPRRLYRGHHRMPLLTSTRYKEGEWHPFVFSRNSSSAYVAISLISLFTLWGPPLVQPSVLPVVYSQPLESPVLVIPLQQQKSELVKILKSIKKPIQTPVSKPTPEPEKIVEPTPSPQSTSSPTPSLQQPVPSTTSEPTITPTVGPTSTPEPTPTTVPTTTPQPSSEPTSTGSPVSPEPTELPTE